MLKLVRTLDRVLGYAYTPSAASRPGRSTSTSAAQGPASASAVPLSELTGLGDVSDVQERWVDRKDAYDQWEEELERERGKGGAGPAAGAGVDARRR